MTNKIVVIGESGQVARNLKKILGDKAIYLDRNQLNLAKHNIAKVLSQFETDIIINAAAYTQVDKAEDEIELAKLINGDSVGIIAEYAKKHNIFFVHYSTDYIFSGNNKDEEIYEDQAPRPLSSYGSSKLLGETNIRSICSKYLIIRTSGVYDSEGQNFVKTMLRLGKNNKEIKVVNDQFISPTYAFDLAKTTIEIINKVANDNWSGIYNISNSGSSSWYNFALNVFEFAKKYNIGLEVDSVNPIPTSEYSTKALRPSYSVLSSKKLNDDLGIVMPTWQNALERCVKEISEYLYENN